MGTRLEELPRVPVEEVVWVLLSIVYQDFRVVYLR